MIKKHIDIPIDYTLETDPETLARVRQAYENMEAGQVGITEKLKEFFQKGKIDGKKI